METLRKTNKVEIFSDRPYYIVETINGKISFKMLKTNSLTEIIETLRELNRMDDNAILIACCYEQYSGGSFNVEVNPDKQYEAIYEYGKKIYKTFINKTIEANIDEHRIPLSKEEIINEKLNNVTDKINRIKFILSDKNDADDIKYWTELLTQFEREQEELLNELKNL